MVQGLSPFYLGTAGDRPGLDRFWRVVTARDRDGCVRLRGHTLKEFLTVHVRGPWRPAIVASGLTAGLALLLASRHPEHVERLVLLLPTGLKGAGKWAATGMANAGPVARIQPLRLSELSFPGPRLSEAG